MCKAWCRVWRITFALTLRVGRQQQCGQQQEMQSPNLEPHGLAALCGCGAATDSL